MKNRGYVRIERLLMENYGQISAIIDAQAPSFEYFLKTQIFDSGIWNIIQKINVETEIYVFSGIIRDFLTGDYSGIRDIDFVLTEDKYFRDLICKLERKNIINVKFNQFGGIKIIFKQIHIDIWCIQNTWGIRNEEKDATVDALIDSAFFNFQAIVYSLRKHKFIYHADFCRFLQTKIMDVVYWKNPNIELCIVNVCHYWTLYGYYISKNLVCWIKLHYTKNMDFIHVQQKHFGKVIYTQEYIKTFINHLFIQLQCIESNGKNT